jgi:hypothetical protein
MSKMSQMMKAGKNNSLSFFLWAVTFVYVSWAGLRGSQVQIGARSSDREFQHQF